MIGFTCECQGKVLKWDMFKSAHNIVDTLGVKTFISQPNFPDFSLPEFYLMFADNHLGKLTYPERPHFDSMGSKENLQICKSQLTAADFGLENYKSSLSNKDFLDNRITSWIGMGRKQTEDKRSIRRLIKLWKAVLEHLSR